jgi:hypothetical protein
VLHDDTLKSGAADSAHAQRRREMARRLRLSTFGSNAWGGRGLYRGISAFSLNPYALVLTVGDAYFRAHNVFARGDTDAQSMQQLHLTFSPVEGLEVALSQYAMANRYDGAATRALQVQGSPMVRLKYGYAPIPDLAVGVYVGLQLPTSAQGTGLQTQAFNLPMSILVSYALLDRVEFVGNLGYTLDHSAKLFGTRTPDELARFAYGVNQVSPLTYALGAQGHLSAGDVVDFAPYVEFTGGMGFGKAATHVNSPFRGTLGLKLYLTQSRSVELSGGADMRLGGAPQASSPFSGEPPWQVFGQVSFHVNDRRPARPGRRTAGACATSADCAEGLSCVQRSCTLLVHEAAHTTFVLAGAVVDGATGEPVANARLTFADFENTVLAGDIRTGQFASWPLATGDAPLSVRIEAPGYGTATQLLPRGQTGEVKQVTLRMDPSAQQAQGVIRGSIKDGHTGRPVPHATAFIPLAGKQMQAADDGTFDAQVQVGVYQVLISAKGYVTQRKQVRVREGDVVIINADLLPRRGHRR